MSRSDRRRAARDAWSSEQIARAARFTAVMFVGAPEMYDKRWASSLEEARQTRDVMAKEYDGLNYGRRCLIYAVTPDDLTILVE
jgi:hypothetical protein